MTAVVAVVIPGAPPECSSNTTVKAHRHQAQLAMHTFTNVMHYIDGSIKYEDNRIEGRTNIMDLMSLDQVT